MLTCPLEKAKNLWIVVSLFELSEEGPVGTDSMQVTNDIERGFCQSYTSYKTHSNWPCYD